MLQEPRTTPAGGGGAKSRARGITWSGRAERRVQANTVPPRGSSGRFAQRPQPPGGQGRVLSGAVTQRKGRPRGTGPALPGLCPTAPPAHAGCRHRSQRAGQASPPRTEARARVPGRAGVALRGPGAGVTESGSGGTVGPRRLPRMANRSPGQPEAARGRSGRRKGWRGRGEANAPKGTDVAAAAAAGPPRSPREFSSNWKALRELLRQKADSSNESLTTCQTYTKNTQPVKAGNSQEVPVTNGNGNAVKVRSTNKMDSCSGKYNSPLTKAKPKRVAMVKNINGTRSDQKDCKDKTKNGDVLKEKDDIKHKRRKAEEHVEQQLKEAEIWFDDVDPKDIEAAIGYEAAKIARRNLGLETGQSSQSVKQVLVKEDAFEGLTRAVAMDCEMVGTGPKGEDSIVARVSIVNQFGKCVYDKYVKPTEEVTDYRTAVSGIRPENINTGEDFKTVQKEVADILNGRILVGHALRNDLKVLFLDHPQKKIRDTQRYKPFRQRVGIKNGRPSLKLLCEKMLNVQVQTSEHCSVQDAQAAMRLYTLEKKKWEAAVKNKSNNKNCKT